MFNEQSPKNSFKRSWMAVSILAGLILVSGLFLPASKNFLKYVSSKVSMLADVLSSVMISETNTYRVTNNDKTLSVNPLLAKAAQMKAEDMAEKGYFSHISPNGKSPWVWFNDVGYVYSYAGENLAVDYTESSDVVNGWINSASHKANLLNPNFTEIGIGVATGTYEGHSATFVVQFFGKPFVSKTSQTESGVNSVAAVNQAITQKTQSLSPISTEVAVATQLGLSDGKVLGTNTNQSDNIIIFAIIGAGLLIILLITRIIVVKRRDLRN